MIYRVHFECEGGISAGYAYYSSRSKAQASLATNRRMKVVCQYCGVVICTVPSQTDGDSHGTCHKCFVDRYGTPEEKEILREYRAGRGLQRWTSLCEWFEESNPNEE